MAVKLATPRLRIVMNEDDDEAIEVQSINADMVRAESTMRQHSWKLQDSPMKFQTILAYVALRRRKLLNDEVKFESFEQTCVSIEAMDLDAKGAPKQATDYAFPTPPDQESG